MYSQSRGFFERLVRLLRGIFGYRMSRAEASNAEAVYHNAIRGQREHHERLKQALGRLIYLRNKTDAALEHERETRELIEHALNDSVNDDDDGRALALIERQRRVDEQLERLERDHERFTDQVREGKLALTEISRSIARLHNERDEMLARKFQALARRDIQATLDDALAIQGSHLQALENVRESIAILETQTSLSRHLVTDEHDLSIDALRRQDVERKDREVLQRLKAKLSAEILPEDQDHQSSGSEHSTPSSAEPHAVS